MERMRQRRLESPAYTHRFYRSEITETEYAQMQEAESEGLIRLRPAGSFLFVDFLPITDAAKLPARLVHVTSVARAENIRQEGLRSQKGRIYMQSPELKVEPEHISLHSHEQKLAVVSVDTSRLLSQGRVIILDPESMHGYVGEFKHSFVVYGSIPPDELKIETLSRADARTAQ